VYPIEVKRITCYVEHFTGCVLDVWAIGRVGLGWGKGDPVVGLRKIGWVVLPINVNKP